MISVFGFKFNDKLFLNSEERSVFNNMIRDGRITIFKMQKCFSIDCSNYVPKGVKKYCSEECYKREEGKDDEETSFD